MVTFPRQVVPTREQKAWSLDLSPFVKSVRCLYVCLFGCLFVRVKQTETPNVYTHNWLATLARFQVCTSSGYSDYLKHIKINIACAQTHALVFPFRTSTGQTSAAGNLSLSSRLPCPLFI